MREGVGQGEEQVLPSQGSEYNSSARSRMEPWVARPGGRWREGHVPPRFVCGARGGCPLWTLGQGLYQPLLGGGVGAWPKVGSPVWGVWAAVALGGVVLWNFGVAIDPQVSPALSSPLFCLCFRSPMQSTAL